MVRVLVIGPQTMSTRELAADQELVVGNLECVSN